MVATLLLSITVLSSCGKKSLRHQAPVQDSSANTQKKQGQSKNEVKKSELTFEADTAIITDEAILNTSFGKIIIGLYGKDAPKTVENFIGLVKKDYYSDVLFHRVAKNFLIQTGDGNTKNLNKKAQWGKGGKSIWGKPFQDEFDVHSPSYKDGYTEGTIAMANRGPNTNTSQFFICLGDAKKLEHKWTIFGKVLEGMDVVKKISTVPIIPGPFEQQDGIPKKPIRLYSIRMIKNDK